MILLGSLESHIADDEYLMGLERMKTMWLLSYSGLGAK